jgi:hypothetical protein
VSPYRKEELSIMIVGVDVSKGHLDVARHEQAGTVRYTNTEAGIAAFVRDLQAAPPRLVVAEATGGYEIALVGTVRNSVREAMMMEKERIITWLSRKNFWTGCLPVVIRTRCLPRTVCSTI